MSTTLAHEPAPPALSLARTDTQTHKQTENNALVPACPFAGRCQVLRLGPAPVYSPWPALRWTAATDTIHLTSPLDQCADIDYELVTTTTRARRPDRAGRQLIGGRSSIRLSTSRSHRYIARITRSGRDRADASTKQTYKRRQ